MRTQVGGFSGPTEIANEFFSLTHHTRWQYTSCNIPSGCRQSSRLPECLGGKRKWLLRRPVPSPLVNPLPRRRRKSRRSAPPRKLGKKPASVARRPPRRPDARVLSSTGRPSGGPRRLRLGFPVSPVALHAHH